MPGPGIAQGESVAAGVEAGDLHPHQLAEHRVDGALARERGAECGERLEDAGFLAYVRVLAEVPDWRSASSQTCRISSSTSLIPSGSILAIVASSLTARG